MHATKPIALPALALAAGMLGHAQTATAQETEQATAELDAQIGFGLTNVDSLDFGTIALAGTGGAVTVDASTGTISKVGDVELVGTPGHRARYTLSAPVNQVLVFVGDANVILTRAGGTETMTATLTYAAGSGLVSELVFGIPIGFKALAPTQELHAGGTLIIPPGQAEGSYTGEFDLTVSYL